jgi:fumarate reductase flavoprotein subunit
MFPSKKKYDLVVVGAGLSGLSAALEAKNQGLDVLVLEKGRNFGGNGNYVEGAMAVDSVLQQKAGIDVDAKKVVQSELEYSHYQASASHLKKFIKDSADNISWLLDQGVEFAKVGPQGDSWPTIHSFKGGGHAAVMAIHQKLLEAGAELVTSISAQKLIMADGQVAGLEIKNESTGQFRTLETANVILATGGYADNPDLVAKRIHTDRILSVSSGKSTGDGLKLAWQAGAYQASMGALQYGGGAIYDKTRPPFVYMASQLAIAATQEAILWVNEHGQRFVNEDVNDNMCHAGAAILTQSKVYAILGQDNIDHLTQTGLYKEVGNSPFTLDKLDKLNDELATHLNHHARFLVKADSIEELAQKLELPALPATVSRYNELVAAKEDRDFYKNPTYLNGLQQGPYYAVELGVGMACAIGGIRVNDDSQVLNDYGYPLEGLYAVGNDAAGMLVGDTYAVTLPGSTAGYAVFSGRNAVKTIVSQ